MTRNSPAHPALQSTSRCDPALQQWDQWLASHHRAVLITLRRDGRAQSSQVVFSWRDGTARISVTAERAKTRNVRRDPRVVLHVLGDDFSTYLALDAVATLSDLAATPDDGIVQELADMYQHITGRPHPDRGQFAAAMIEERRLILRATALTATPRRD